MGKNIYHRPVRGISLFETHLWHWLHGLSLDVSLGALGIGLLIHQAIQAEPVLAEFIALWSAVSLIYTLDHLLDLPKVNGVATPRRRFHQAQSSLLKLFCALSGIIGLCTLPYLEQTSLYWGGVLSLCCLFYIWLTQRRTQPLNARSKKALVALIYPLGVCLPTLASLSVEQCKLYWKLLGLVYLSCLAVVLSNLLLFHIAEKQTGIDISKPTRWRSLIVFFAICPWIALAFLCIFDPYQKSKIMIPLIYLGLIGLVHIFVRQNLNHLIDQERYRCLADGAFLISWLSLWR